MCPDPLKGDCHVHRPEKHNRHKTHAKPHKRLAGRKEQRNFGWSTANFLTETQKENQKGCVTCAIGNKTPTTAPNILLIP
jgi:hypothetical protein